MPTLKRPASVSALRRWERLGWLGSSKPRGGCDGLARFEFLVASFHVSDSFGRNYACTGSRYEFIRAHCHLGNRQQLDLENERGVGRDRPGVTRRAVGQFARHMPVRALADYGRSMKCASIATGRVVLPSFGLARTFPDIPTELYQARLARTVERLRAEGQDALVVYADREHCANMAYLTGFDPRFAEALLLLSSEGRRKLFVGNECLGYLPDTQALGLEVELFQEFSLMGQPRNASRPLREIFRDFGLGHAQCIGCAGWKYFGEHLLPGGPQALDAPAYLADLLRGRKTKAAGCSDVSFAK
jgi:hypothetical protein